MFSEALFDEFVFRSPKLKLGAATAREYELCDILLYQQRVLVMTQVKMPDPTAHLRKDTAARRRWFQKNRAKADNQVKRTWGRVKTGQSQPINNASFKVRSIDLADLRSIVGLSVVGAHRFPEPAFTLVNHAGDSIPVLGINTVDFALLVRAFDTPLDFALALEFAAEVDECIRKDRQTPMVLEDCLTCFVLAHRRANGMPLTASDAAKALFAADGPRNLWQAFHKPEGELAFRKSQLATSYDFDSLLLSLRRAPMGKAQVNRWLQPSGWAARLRKSEWQRILDILSGLTRMERQVYATQMRRLATDVAATGVTTSRTLAVGTDRNLCTLLLAACEPTGERLQLMSLALMAAWSAYDVELMLVIAYNPREWGHSSLQFGAIGGKAPPIEALDESLQPLAQRLRELGLSPTDLTTLT